MNFLWRNLLVTLLIYLGSIGCTKSNGTASDEDAISTISAPTVSPIFTSELVQGFLGISGPSSVTARAGSGVISFKPEIVSVIEASVPVTFTCVYDVMVDELVDPGNLCIELANLSFDIETGELSWSPALNQKGYFEFKISMSQGSNSTDILFTAAIRTDFITRWQTDNAGTSNNDQITLPLVDDGTYDFVVDWGDSQTDEITTWDDVKTTHTYLVAGTYTVTIYGQVDGWRFNNAGDKLKILEITNWGNLRIGDRDGYFWGASNLTIPATDILDTTLTTNWEHAFTGCSSIDDIPGISQWDMSRATNMKNMFEMATLFDSDVGGWDVSNVTDMSFMFRLTAFNKDISSWDTGNVTTMNYLFYNSSFNQEVSNWNVSKVREFALMFAFTSFNGDISAWDTSSAEDFAGMFQNNASFNGNISSWDVSKVTIMSQMFSNATSFNQNLSTWDTSSVTNFAFMFFGATIYNQDLGAWNLSSASNMGSMLSFSGISVTNYSNTLIAWNNQVSLPNDIALGAGATKFSAGAAAAHANLVGPKNWTITDGGQE